MPWFLLLTTLNESIIFVNMYSITNLLARIAFGTILASSTASSIVIHQPIVNTTFGLLQGSTSEYRDGVYAFKGIPYAEPPIGDARWTTPVRPANWSGIRNAAEFALQCPQLLDLGQSLWTTGSSNMSEDCLYLNIWTPTIEPDAKLPVYVWIYGGRFTGGSGDVLTYDGSGFAVQDIIVVTINYRLGALGFLAHPELSAESPHNSSGNYGTMDLIASLKWVRDEIENFGGDPNRITVGGQSSGSSCALDTFYSPLSFDLIAGVIAESGPRAPRDPLTGSLATSYRSMEEALASGQVTLLSLNVSSISEARKLPFDTLTALSDEYATIFEGTPFINVINFEEPPAWRPVLDNYVLNQTYAEALRSNNHANVPILAGNNKDESGASPDPGYTVGTYVGNFTAMFGNFSHEFFSLYPASIVDEANNQSNAFWRDLSRVSSWQWANELLAGGDQSSVFTYFWTHVPPAQTDGAFHGAEMAYVFNNIPYNYPSEPYEDVDYLIQGVVTRYWANFIKTGNPNGGNLTYWSPSGDDKTTMWIGDN
jgi:carboxylesterase 2